MQPTNIFNSAFFVKVVDVPDVIREQEREDDELAAIVSWILLSGGNQASGGSSGISLDNPASAILLSQALSHSRGRSDILPLLIAMSGTPGGTQSNILPLLLLTSARHRPRRILGELEEPGRSRAARESRSEFDDLRLRLAEEHGRLMEAEALLARMSVGQEETESGGDGD